MYRAPSGLLRAAGAAAECDPPPCACLDLSGDAAAPSYALCARGRLHWALISLRLRAERTLLSVLVFFYAPVASKTLALWRCEEIGRARVLVADVRVDCDGAEWAAYAAVGAAAAVLYVAGIPLALAGVVWRAKVARVGAYTRLLAPMFRVMRDAARGEARAAHIARLLRVTAPFHPPRLRRRARAQEGAREEGVRPPTLAEVAARPTHAAAVAAAVGEANAVLCGAPSGGGGGGGAARHVVALRFTAGDLLREASEAVAAAAAADGSGGGSALPPDPTARDMAGAVRGWCERANLASMWTALACGPVYDGYRPGAWWYELVETARKLVLTGAIMFVPDAGVQIIVVTLVAAAAALLVVGAAPYAAASDNRSAGALSTAVLVAAFGGVVLQFGGARGPAGTAAALQGVGAAIVWCYGAVLCLVGAWAAADVAAGVDAAREAAADERALAEPAGREEVSAMGWEVDESGAAGPGAAPAASRRAARVDDADAVLVDVAAHGRREGPPHAWGDGNADPLPVAGGTSSAQVVGV